jgi:hypothetical protein
MSGHRGEARGEEGSRGSCTFLALAVLDLSMCCCPTEAAARAASWACGRCADEGEQGRVAQAGGVGGGVPEAEGR